jgi:hypothetical protein
LLKTDTKFAFLAAPVDLPEPSVPETVGVPERQIQLEERVDPPSLRADLQELFKVTVYWVLLKLR